MIRPVLGATMAVALPVVAVAQLQPPLLRRPAGPPPTSLACDDPEHRQFDFWVGRWSVSPTGQPRVVATSLIERLYGGCAIRENWMPTGQPGGGSLSSYVPFERGWRQTWVDSSGARAEFKGGWNGQALVLTGPWPLKEGRARLVRMTYTPNSDGTVRQAGESSYDEGKTWSPTFDFTYRRSSPALRVVPIVPR